MTASREETERQLLQALCAETADGGLHELARRLLENYCWSEPARQLVFRAVVEMNTRDPEVLRAELPPRLTRQGFPDVDWEEFFQPLSLTRQEVERLIRELAGTIA